VVRVLHRQPLTRGSGVAVVEVAGRMLVLGTTEQQVSLLTELDPFELEEETASVSPLFGLSHRPSAETVAPTTENAPTESLRGRSALDSSLQGGTDVAPAHLAEAFVASAPSRARGGSHRAARPVAHGSALSGSILAPATWRQAVAAVTGRAS